jgi:hypothetical protein
MKKILAISVACMYLAITSGLVLQIHYCMGRQVGSSVKFAEAETHACSKCGMQNAKNKCCHDEVKFIKLQDVHKQVTADYQLTPPVAIVQEFNLINPQLHLTADTAEVCNNSPPDDDTGQPSIFLLNGVFRI